MTHLRPGLAVIAVLELVTLLALLVNLATVHNPTLAQVVGPIHGMLYLLGIALAWLTARSWRARVLSVIPLVGAFLAWRSLSPGRRADHLWQRA